MNAAALITVAPLLERYVGTIAFIAVYVMSGLTAAAVNLWWRPVTVSGAAAGPIFGLYGLLLASVIWSVFHRWRQSRRSPDPEGGDTPEEPLTIFIPSSAIAWTLPAALAFVVSNIASDDLATAAELAAFGVGFTSGVVIARRAFQAKPAARQLGLITAAAGAIVIAIAVPVRGIADVKPEIERVVALEDRTTGAYRATYERYAHGKITAEALAKQIDAIVPDLQAEDDRLRSLEGVPQEHQGLVADAENTCACVSTAGDSGPRRCARPAKSLTGTPDRRAWLRMRPGGCERKRSTGRTCWRSATRKGPSGRRRKLSSGSGRDERTDTLFPRSGEIHRSNRPRGVRSMV